MTGPELKATKPAVGHMLSSCPSCGSGIRTEPGYVPGFTGMPVTCSDEWHDEED